MLHKLFLTVVIAVVGAVSATAAPKSFDHGDLTLKVNHALQIFAKGDRVPFIDNGHSASFQTSKGWRTSDFRGRWVTKANTAELKLSNAMRTFDFKAVLIPNTSAFSLNINMTAAEKIDMKRGTMPSLNINKKMTLLTLPGRQAIELLPKNGQKTYQLRTWAVFASKDDGKNALMIIIPDLEVWDFSAGGSINVGGFARGTGWTPGMDVTMPDFNRNTMQKGDKAQSLIIFAVVPKNSDYAKAYTNIMAEYQKMAE